MRPWFRPNDTEVRNAAARKAYEAVLTVSLRKPTSKKYKKFSEEVKRRAEKMYKNFTYGEEQVGSLLNKDKIYFRKVHSTNIIGFFVCFFHLAYVL